MGRKKFALADSIKYVFLSLTIGKSLLISSVLVG